jgi:(+)-trans-carveol dehydrogenase
MRQAVDEAVATLGRLDSVVINHGIIVPHQVTGPGGADTAWDVTLETNLSGVWRTARAVVPHLIERGGSVTVTASTAALVGLFQQAGYVAAKHGVIGLVKTLAAELAQHWIRVNAVCPGGVDTPLYLNDNLMETFVGHPGATREEMDFPAKTLNLLPVPWIEPIDVAYAVAFLASDEAKYITGAALPVDAGSSIQPPGISPLVGQRLAELGG